MVKFKSVLAKICCILFFFLTSICMVLGNESYVSLKKYINMNMYGDAYNEILRFEITKDEIDPALQKLRVDMLEETKRQMLKRLKTNKNDPAVYTILADIAFQQTDFDNAMLYISKALNIKSGPLSNYVCAKIQYCQNNIDQAYSRMSYVLESMPDSTVVFNDFQFLYSCKTYGKETAMQLSHNSNFVKRATPLAVKKNKAPISPFQNDPTKIAVAVKQPTYEDTKPDFSDIEATEDEEDDFDLEDNDEEFVIAKNSKVGKVKETDKQQLQNKSVPKSVKNDPLPDEDFGDFDTLDEFDNEFDMAQKTSDAIGSDNLSKPVIANANIVEKKEVVSKEKSDSISDKNKKAAKSLVDKAYKSFMDEDYRLARDQFNDALKLYPDVEDPKGIKKKIDKHFEMSKKYSDAIDYFETSSFKEAKPLFEEVYEYDPKMYSYVPFYLAQILGSEENPDRQKMLKYLNAIISDKDTELEMFQNALLLKLQVLIDEEQFDEAKKIFNELETKHGTWFKQQEKRAELRDTINIHLWWKPIVIGISCLLIITILILVLSMKKGSMFSSRDPIEAMQKYIGANNYRKAISYGEKVVAKGLPIQIEREILEMLAKVYYETNDIEKCKDAASKILKNFPTNNVAWVYLAKTSVALNDTSNEAITMYENMYKENPTNLEYIPILAKHYIKENNTTPEALQIINLYYQQNQDKDDKDVILALADGFVNNRTISNEAIALLEKAITIKEKVEYHELLARNYARMNNFDKAANSCLFVLNKNIDNMGIHVVYTNCMKKNNRIPEALKQYNKFLEKHPDNPQIQEIIKGLENDMNERKVDIGLPDLPVDSHFEAADENSQIAQPEQTPIIPDIKEAEKTDFNVEASVENFVEPPPEGFDPNDLPGEVPLPDFLKNDNIAVELPKLEPRLEEKQKDDVLPTFEDFQASIKAQQDNSGISANEQNNINGSDWSGLEPAERTAEDLPTLDPFNLSDTFLSELGNESSNENNSNDVITPIPAAQVNVAASKLQTEQNLAKAQAAANSGKWDEVVFLLNNDYASSRNKDMGILLIKARLEQKKPIMALELVNTLNLDPEMMTNDMKDLLYDVAIALEDEKKYKEALRLYDKICNVDINYKDAFDRSDKLYGMKS